MRFGSMRTPHAVNKPGPPLPALERGRQGAARQGAPCVPLAVSVAGRFPLGGNPLKLLRVLSGPANRLLIPFSEETEQSSAHNLWQQVRDAGRYSVECPGSGEFWFQRIGLIKLFASSCVSALRRSLRAAL